MTIATARTFEFSVGQIVRQAYLDAGLLNVNQSPNAAQYQDGVDKLQRISSSAAVMGFLARVTDFYSFPLVATEGNYSLPEYAVDVTGSGMYLAPSSTAEVAVNAINRERWQQISSKESTVATPSYYFVNRAEVPIQVKIWPIPGAGQDGGVVRLQIHKFRADVRSTTVTADYERFWVDYLVFELAARFCLSNSLSADRFTSLQGKADRALKECKAYSRQRGRQVFKLGGSNPWRGR